ncbi:MAG: DUF3592 domain-containing protein [Thermoanaerobaculia bacterium]
MLVPSIAAALGTILVLVIYHRSSAKIAAEEATWRKGKIVTDATLARCTETEDGDYGWNIEYSARDGQRYQISGVYDFPPADVGKKVRIAYDPRLPSEARLLIDEAKETGPFAAFFVLIFSYAAFFIVAMTIKAFLTAR